MGVGADGYDFAAQLPESAEIIRRGQEAAAAVHAAGVQLQPLPLGGKDAEDLVDDLPVVVKGERGFHRASGALVQIGHVGQHIKILMNPDAFQHGLKITPLGLKNRLSLPVFREVDVNVVHKMDGTQDKVVVPLLQFLPHPLCVVVVQTVLHTPADGQPGHLQGVVFRAVRSRIKQHGLFPFLPEKIPVVGEADFLQPRLHCGLGQLEAGVVAVEGDSGVHMKVKHDRFPPKTDGMRWAALPGSGFPLW